MEILLSYCKTHFDPDKKPEEHQFWDSSAASIARGLYNVLKNYGNVTYIQPNELSKIQGKHYDLFVGRDLNFHRILQCAHITKSIYVAVNMHYSERNNLLQGFISQGNLPLDAISGQDLVYTADQIQSLTVADHILCFGNNNTMNTYLKNGVDIGKIHVVNYDVGDVSVAPTLKDEEDRTWRYLYVASEIGLRKGFDILYDIFTNKLVADQNIKLDIVGEFSTPYHQRKYEAMKTLLGDKVTFHGWVDSGTAEYRKILENSDFIVFPSIEEGQPGTVLDAIKCQVVPILTKNCGIDFSPLGMLDIQIGSANNVNIVLKSMNLTQQEYLHLKKHTVDYYTYFHSNWIAGLSKLISNCMKNQLYPPISVILPIYNKEHSIQELLFFLHKACTAYANIQLLLFFDGCEDGTERVVKNFFDEHKPIYEVIYHVTPNLFETRTNNLGIMESTGEYCVIIQDDTYIYDENIFFEIASFMDKANNCVILGGLAGVNYYPIGFKLPLGSGQQVQNPIETYWRQDGNTDPTLQEKIFKTDAVMRGPFVIRKTFIDQFGPLDESYVPFCVDDMDICYRAKSLGYDVYCMLMNVENRRLSMAKYTSAKYAWFEQIYERNMALFYSKWKPDSTKEYSWVHRFRITT